MSDNLPALSGGLFPSKLDRQVSRAIARTEAESKVARHRDQVRLGLIAGTTHEGMLIAAQIGMVEAALAQEKPWAASYVKISASAGAMNVARVVHNSGWGG